MYRALDWTKASLLIPLVCGLGSAPAISMSPKTPVPPEVRHFCQMVICGQMGLLASTRLRFEAGWQNGTLCQRLLRACMTARPKEEILYFCEPPPEPLDPN